MPGCLGIEEVQALGMEDYPLFQASIKGSILCLHVFLVMWNTKDSNHKI